MGTAGRPLIVEVATRAGGRGGAAAGSWGRSDPRRAGAVGGRGRRQWSRPARTAFPAGSPRKGQAAATGRGRGPWAERPRAGPSGPETTRRGPRRPRADGQVGPQVASCPAEVRLPPPEAAPPQAPVSVVPRPRGVPFPSGPAAPASQRPDRPGGALTARCPVPGARTASPGLGGWPFLPRSVVLFRELRCLFIWAACMCMFVSVVS